MNLVKENLNEKSYKELLLGDDRYEINSCKCKFCCDVRKRRADRDIDEYI